ncbi:MFS transporter [Micromonospora sp. NPDC005206]|uniref:MFS transporter n=1 Tax=Micromonospora sp. NPDC005206 TaxID=3157022 RepID=UPI0033B4595A
MSTVEAASRTRYRWVVLAVGIAAQASTAAFFQGLASVGPVIRAEGGFTLAQLGIVLGAPMAGFVATLLPWGLASDRFPERAVMAVGLSATTVLLLVSSTGSGLWPLTVSLGLAGAAAASVNAASGRAVLRWFSPVRRGLAMGLRQTAIPLGAAAAALVLPLVVEHGGVARCIQVLSLGTAAAALASWRWVREPPVAAPEASGAEGPPPRGSESGGLALLVLAGCGLVVCQATFMSFSVEMLHGDGGLTLKAAALVFVIAQLGGAAGRVAVGLWSDRTVDRVAPLVCVALAIGTSTCALGAVTGADPAVVVPMAVVAGSLAICWNGLVFTATAEMAPAHRVSTALGAQSTANYLMASVAPFALGSLIGARGFGVGFGAAGAVGLAVGALLLLTRPTRNAQ